MIQEEFVKVFNRIVNEDSPAARIVLGKELAASIGRLLMMPSACLEQLVNKLEQEHKFYEGRRSSSLLLDALLGQAESLKTIATLRAFLKCRSAMCLEMEKHGSPKLPE